MESPQKHSWVQDASMKNGGQSWDSGDCIDLFGRDRPSSEEESRLLLASFRTRLLEVVQDKS